VGSELSAGEVKRLARDCGFDLAGVARAEPLAEAGFYMQWVGAGLGGEMAYLGGRRAALRQDPRRLVDWVCSVICVGKLYNGPAGPISRYACGPDYHVIVGEGLRRLAAKLEERAGPFKWRISVDTAPLLERAYARRAGLGWIGKNTCLIDQRQGSFFFLGELLVSLDLEPDAPVPDRCGKCRRCIEACPTKAIIPTGQTQPAWMLDSRRCISYLTIELRGAIPAEFHPALEGHVFGCDICQEVCPWNRKTPPSGGPAASVEELASLTEAEFQERFRGTAVLRARYHGFRRNLALGRDRRRG
jgi:epoxyqueuosine reductase